MEVKQITPPTFYMIFSTSDFDEEQKQFPPKPYIFGPPIIKQTYRMKYTKNNRISGKWFPTDQVGKNNVQATSLLEIRIKINCSVRDKF